MQIERIEFMKVFGMFDHDIKLKLSDRITIIHGPNGVGKTTILQLIKDIFSKKFFVIKTVPFSKVLITFTDKQKLEIKKNGNETINLILRKGRKILHRGSIDFSMPREELTKDFPTHIIEDVIPHLDRTGPSRWFDSSTGEMISLKEVLYRYGNDLPFVIGSPDSIPQEINDILDSLKTYFIQTQRLLVLSHEESYRSPRNRVRTRNTVEKYSNEMAENLQESLRKSGSVAASLDRTFPHRLLESGAPKEATEKNIREKYQNQTAYRNRLMKAGLIDAEEQVSLPTSNIDANDLKLLWYYLNDIDEKLKVFDPLMKKVELFKDIINSRFLYKSFYLNKSEGFVFTLDSGENVPLKSLSSGEQHELVLAYELLFKVPEKSFIMIDEPELSLHVTWQHKFLKDLERISKLADLDFLIATHSPSIIHDRRSLMVSLPKGGKDA